MKKLLIFLLLLALNASFAYKYSGGKGDTWSTAKWRGYGHSNVPNRLPGAGDFILFYTDMKLDTDVTLKEMSAGGGLLVSDGKNLTITADVDFSMRKFTLDFKNAKIIFGGNLKYSTDTDVSEYYGANILLNDASFELRSSLSASVAREIKNKAPAYNIISLKGKSLFKVGGVMVLDSLLTNPKENLGFKFEIIEKDGNVPTVYLGSGDMAGVLLNVKAGASALPGKYVIFKCGDKDAKLKNMKISFDGQAYTLGKDVKAGSHRAKISLLNKPEKGVAEALVLEISK